MNITKPIYLDYNATTPIDREVASAMQPYLIEYFGNPSSAHWYGIKAKEAVENARKQVASLIGAEPSEIVFTSGGTESNNYAIKGIAFAKKSSGNHIITGRIEHPAVIEVCKYLEENGCKVSYVPVDTYGMVSVSDIEKKITPQTILITIMHANNEVGTIEPIEDIFRLAKKRGIVLHTDAAQTVGKISVNVQELGVDLLSVAGHKVYTPKGVGALYIRRGIALSKFMHGAGHESGRRAGTENVLEIVGLGKACEIAERDLKKNKAHMKELTDMLYNGLREQLKDKVRLNGHPEKRLPNTLNLSFKGLDTNKLLSKISGRLAVSAGSACHSGEIRISPVLEAMAVPLEWARGTIRFSTGRMTTKKEIKQAITIVSDAVKQLE